MDELLSAAIDYGKLGFKVFPVTTVYNERIDKWEKKPTCPNGFKAAKTEEDDLIALFTQYPGSHVGLVHNNMAIVDADGEKGVQTLNRILSQLPEASVIVRSISGGIHYYIPGVVSAESRKVRLLEGLDLLTGNEKGFAVVPPSPGYAIILGSFESLAEDISGLGKKTNNSEGSQ